MKSFMQKNASKEGLGNDDDFFCQSIINFIEVRILDHHSAIGVRAHCEAPVIT